ncbi:MAG: 3-dehydroquinate synthase II [Deltaproteobacteria bacterium]|nr:3-dehydroquinate synthase II [Deltaproteobacteria bacterium]
MKEVWVKADPWQKELVTTALEGGADAVMVASQDVGKVKELGVIQTVSHEGDIRWEEDVVLLEISSTEDEDKIVDMSRHKKVVVRTTDWNVIPLENLVARTQNIFVEADNPDDAKMALTVLEKGVDGLVITAMDPVMVKEMLSLVKSERQKLELCPLEIRSVRSMGMGDRVCVDTCTMMGEGEGILVGNSSKGLFLVHAESIENPYVAPRPFRVNAGAVHAYVSLPGGKTSYLSELKAGKEVLCVNWKGEAVSLVVGRVKIEQRPLLLVEAMGPDGEVSMILQNAETIRLVGKEGQAISVVNLHPGDVVLGRVEAAGRHFGHKINESIIEN